MAEPAVDRLIAHLTWLDPFAKWLQGFVRAIFSVLGAPGAWLKSLLHGSFPIGHPLHPTLTDVPIGAWTVALVADAARAFGVAVPSSVAQWSLLVGVLAGSGAVVTGYVDYSETAPGIQRRTAVVHGLLMTVAFGLAAAALLVGHYGSFAVSFTCLAASYVLVIVGGYFGGHLVFHRGVQVNFNAFAHGPAKDYVAVGASDDFPEGEMKQVKAGPMYVLVVRIGGRLYAIDNACSHAGGPLHKGTLAGFCVTCPWHGSQFDVRTGRVKRGPATAPEPQLSVRETDGEVEVRLAHPL